MGGQLIGRVRLIAVLVGIAVAIGVGMAVASPPPSASMSEFDGRTWLSVQRESGPQLLLVNGISGLIEASAELEGVSEPARFVDAGRGHTLFRSGDTLIVIDDANHVAATVPVGAGDRAVLAADRVLVVGERASVLPLTLEGGPVPLRDAPAPVGTSPPVVDSQDRAWYLAAGDVGSARSAVRVDPGGGVEVFEVAPTTEALSVVNGRAHAVGAAVVPVEGDGPARSSAGAGGTAPSVAIATKGLWATADGPTLTTRLRGTVADRTLDGEVTDLGVWHGSLVATTTSGAVHGRPGNFEVIPDVGAGAALHLDGGLLWVTTAETAIAIDPHQKRISIPISSADLSLCVGDCSAAAASSFLEQAAANIPPPPPPKASKEPTTSTTEPPKKLEVASVTPTLPSTTVPKPSSSPTTVGTTQVPPPVTPADDVTTTIQNTAPPPGNRPTEPPGTGKDKEPKDPPPVITAPTIRPTVTTSTSTSTSTTEAPAPEPKPEPQPEPVGLEYDVVGGDLSATAYIRVLARPSDCGEIAPATKALLSWTGSSTGSREVLITWPSMTAKRSENATATIVAEAGELRVTVTVCGVTATDSAVVTDPRPTTTTTTTTPTTTTTTTTTPSTTTTPTTTTTTTTPTSTTLPTSTTTVTPPTSSTTTTRPTTTTTGRTQP